jgi:DNA polymerase-3 subunit gamma/tau
MAGDVSSVLLTFNEVLEKGFDGHNFISGLNSHLRDLLVSKDESTLRLLEATPAIKKRYFAADREIAPLIFFSKLSKLEIIVILTIKAVKIHAFILSFLL